jgi:hypothetical protein
MVEKGSPAIISIMTTALNAGDLTDMALRRSDKTEGNANRTGFCGMFSVRRNWLNKSSTVRSKYH